MCIQLLFSESFMNVFIVVQYIFLTQQINKHKQNHYYPRYSRGLNEN